MIARRDRKLAVGSKTDRALDHTKKPPRRDRAALYGIRAKRSKSGAVSFDLVELEARHASFQ